MRVVELTLLGSDSGGVHRSCTLRAPPASAPQPIAQAAVGGALPGTRPAGQKNAHACGGQVPASTMRPRERKTRSFLISETCVVAVAGLEPATYGL